ncbi:MAG: hypothetical protein EXR50_00855 [Dehalococcoidia bacterium]|nr:hypothetical protein [Dehalococcoidia bacterium]
MTQSKGVLPPYGPVSGMLQGLALLQKGSVARVNEELLRSSRIAPGNEYKVIGALKFLGVIDDNGAPTENGRAFRTKGPVYALALQEAVRRSYEKVFSKVDIQQATKDDLYNHFIMDWSIGPEMATKASRFFIELCRMGNIPISAPLSSGSRRKGIRATYKPRQAVPKAQRDEITRASNTTTPVQNSSYAGQFPPIILALTPDTAKMNEDELVELFKKMVSAFRRAAASS